MKKERGRPTTYDPETHDKIVYLAALSGMVDKKMARELGISPRTLTYWKTNHKTFSEALKKGKETFINNTIVSALVKRATGFYENDRYYPPSEVAIIYYLNNRMPTEWSNNRKPVIDEKDLPELKIIYTHGALDERC